MKNQFAIAPIVAALFSGILTPSFAGDIDCVANSLLGGNCLAIERVNKFQEKQQAAWMAGTISATDMVKSVVEYHKSQTSVDSYNSELYIYSLQVANVCDTGKISKQEGLYLMSKKENELGERIRANQPPPNRPLTCVSETVGSQVITKCK